MYIRIRSMQSRQNRFSRCMHAHHNCLQKTYMHTYMHTCIHPQYNCLQQTYIHTHMHTYTVQPFHASNSQKTSAQEQPRTSKEPLQQNKQTYIHTHMHTYTVQPFHASNSQKASAQEQPHTSKEPLQQKIVLRNRAFLLSGVQRHLRWHQRHFHAF